MKSQHFVLLVVLLVVVACSAKVIKEKCENPTLWEGCNVDQQFKQCECDVKSACENPFEYQSIKACISDIYEDVCSPDHCKNGGLCLQSNHKSFKCDCAGSGFYGDRCQHECPSRKKLERAYEMPDACIY